MVLNYLWFSLFVKWRYYFKSCLREFTDAYRELWHEEVDARL